MFIVIWGEFFFSISSEYIDDNFLSISFWLFLLQSLFVFLFSSINDFITLPILCNENKTTSSLESLLTGSVPSLLLFCVFSSSLFSFFKIWFSSFSSILSSSFLRKYCILSLNILKNILFIISIDKLLISLMDFILATKNCANILIPLFFISSLLSLLISINLPNNLFHKFS